MDNIGNITSFHTSYTIASLVALFLLLTSLHRYIFPPKHVQEPPYIHSPIPLLGHLIYLASQGCAYLDRLEKQYHYSIYTLPILRGRQYMICTPDWLNAVHKNSKTISFNELIAQVLEKVFRQDKPTMEILRRNMNDEEGNRNGVMLETHAMIGSVLGYGPRLDQITRNVLNEETSRINRLARHGEEDFIRLWAWLRHNLSMASINAIYGPENPYALDESLMQDFWDFDTNVVGLMVLPFPSLTVRKGFQARKRLFDAYTDYFQKDRHKQAAEWIQKRAQIAMDRYGISVDNHARSEVSMNIAILSNTIPSAFWFLVFILSSPDLLASIRAEVSSACTATSQHTINLTHLKTKCPLLGSTFRETLRYVGYLNSGRIVVQDTLVTNHSRNETYLLRKGSMLQIATNLIHFNQEIYGADAADFRPERFLHMEEGSSSGVDPAAPFRDTEGKIHSGAFRTWGSGNAICLGRHFATSEILALTALFVLGFEVTDKEGAGDTFTAPSLPSFRIPGGGIPHSQQDPKVRVRRRRGYENVVWEFAM